MSLTSYTYSRGFKSGEFHHAVLSISGTVHTLYLDGSAVVVNSSAGDIFANNSSITTTTIGANNLLQNAFRGIIGDFQVYNYAISSRQVSNLYVNRNLVVHYTFDTFVNNLIPNYAILTYDASFVGNAALISPGFIGTSALSIANTGETASQYVLSKRSFNLNSATGLTISCWVNADITGNVNKIMRIFDISPRIFDISPSAGIRGISVDFSGTNMIYSSYNKISRVIDTLSTTAYNNIVYSGTGPALQAGAFGCKLLLFSAINLPIIQIKKGTSGTPTDFYAPIDGTTKLTTITGIGIVDFLGGETGYVTIWYDQTGNGHHATAAGTTLPTFNTTSSVVDFGLTGYFSLPDNSYPTGNSNYTYIYKQGVSYITNPSVTKIVFSGGTSKRHIVLNRSDNLFNNIWTGTGGNNYTELVGGVLGNVNNVIVITYGGGSNNNTIPSGVLMYRNNTFEPTTHGGTATRNQDATTNYLGNGNPPGTDTYKSTMPYFYWMPYSLQDSDRAILVNT